MVTVPQAARLTGRNPETIRRWIREGKLPARKIGTQHVIEEADLDPLLGASSDRGLATDERRPAALEALTRDVSVAIRRSRANVLTGLIADGRVTPALEPDTQSLPMPQVSSTGVTATMTLLAEREQDRR